MGWKINAFRRLHDFIDGGDSFLYSTQVRFQHSLVIGCDGMEMAAGKSLLIIKPDYIFEHVFCRIIW